MTSLNKINNDLFERYFIIFIKKLIDFKINDEPNDNNHQVAFDEKKNIITKCGSSSLDS